MKGPQAAETSILSHVLPGDLAGIPTALLFAMPQEVDPLKTGQDIRDRAFRFACRIVGLCEKLYQTGGVARLMAPQLLRCGTSVAAMLDEAKAAESRRDFISKCSIALKESRETHVRLRILEAATVGPVQDTRPLRVEAHEIMSILGAILRNTRRRLATPVADVRPRS